MNISDKFNEGFKFINKIKWIVLIPVLLDLLQLISYQQIYREKYIPLNNFFTIKIGIISAPPSVSFLLENFPTALFSYNTNQFRGIINQLSLFNVLLVITIVLMMSFVHSRYLSVLNKEIDSPVSIRDFFTFDNQLWKKFFIFQMLTMVVPMMLTLYKPKFIYLGLINIIFIYVNYSMVVDGGSIWYNIKRGTRVLFDNMWETIKMALYFGAIFSVLSIIIHLVARFGMIGIIIAMIIIAYVGAMVNKAVLEIYREFSQE